MNFINFITLTLWALNLYLDFQTFYKFENENNYPEILSFFLFFPLALDSFISNCWQNPKRALVLNQQEITFFSIWVLFHEHSRFTGQQGKREAISLTPLYHFHSFLRHVDILRAFTANSSPLHVGSSLLFPIINTYMSLVNISTNKLIFLKF